ncbi:MAG: hypothetical protein ACRYFU_06165 [Janthinobacterium lividum]
MLRNIRDARSTRNAERQLLDALGLRCNPKKKYMCWPSYHQLSLDTGLDSVTLKRAAKRLEDRNLIKRVVRQNRSCLFYLNVALLQEQAEAVKAAEEASRQAVEEDESPFEMPTLDESCVSTEGYDADADWLSGGAQ